MITAGGKQIDDVLIVSNNRFIKQDNRGGEVPSPREQGRFFGQGQGQVRDEFSILSVWLSWGYLLHLSELPWGS